MPRKAASSEEPEKAQRLSLAELAAHDDACSDAMVDNAYFKSSRIRKNRTKHIPIRGIKEDDVPQILLQKVIVEKDPVAAEKVLLKLAGLKRYRKSLRTNIEQEHFLRHLRKYIHMYMTDCPWEVSTTNRYTITTYEAAVTARRRIKQGEIITHLTGTLVPLTSEESADLDLTNRNFSIVVSSRKKNSSIFLGPARFANHDCDANGRLVIRGSDGMEVVAMKNIEIGDEITVSYSDDYFGPANIDCLCHTCEVLERNGWTPGNALDGDTSNLSTPEPGVDEGTASSRNSKKRKHNSEARSSLSTPVPSAKKPRAGPSPSKLQQSWTPPTSNESDTAPEPETTQLPEQLPSEGHVGLSPPFSPTGTEAQVSEPSAASQTSKDRGFLSMTKVSEPRLDKLTARLRGVVPEKPQLATPSPSEASNPCSDSNAQISIKLEAVEVSRLETDVIPVPNLLTPEPQVVTLTTTHLSEIVPSIEPATVTETSTTKITVRPVSDRLRTPGDYLLTRKLLAQPHDRWIQCQNALCMGLFVQPNGYQTRRECPRCERHSMLYGFPWPKTDPDPRKMLERIKSADGRGKGKKKTGLPPASAFRRQGKCGKGSWVEGGGDDEERVLDHRTVHRFVLPEEERVTTRKGLLREAEQARLRRGRLDEDGLVRRSVGSGDDGFGRDRSLDGSGTPDGDRRRSNRFVTKMSHYADV